MISDSILQYTFNDLLDLVQASQAEIKDALVKFQALVIDGKMVLEFLINFTRT